MWLALFVPVANGGRLSTLHNGALQDLLVARHDLSDARELGDANAFARLDQ